MKSLLIAATVVLAGSAVAVAYEPGGDGFEDRQSRQMQRIEAGRRSGDITWSEGNTLRAEQRGILASRQQMLADGGLSRDERRRLRRMLDHAEMNIANQMSNNLRRARWLPRVGR